MLQRLVQNETLPPACGWGCAAGGGCCVQGRRWAVTSPGCRRAACTRVTWVRRAITTGWGKSAGPRCITRFAQPDALRPVPAPAAPRSVAACGWGCAAPGGREGCTASVGGRRSTVSDWASSKQRRRTAPSPPLRRAARVAGRASRGCGGSDRFRMREVRRPGCHNALRGGCRFRRPPPAARLFGGSLPHLRSPRARVAITRFPPRDAGGPFPAPAARGSSPRPPACGWGCARGGGALHP